MKTRRPPAPKSDEQVITKETPEVADRRQLILSAVEPLRMKTRLAGLFLFLPLLAKLRFDFFHMDCLSSEVRLNVDLDVTLIVIANGCYRWLASRLKGFEKAKPKQLWRKFVETGGMIEVLPNRHLRITFDRRSHNPILREAALDQDCFSILLAETIPHRVRLHVMLRLTTARRVGENVSWFPPCGNRRSNGKDWGRKRLSPPSRRRLVDKYKHAAQVSEFRRKPLTHSLALRARKTPKVALPN